MSEQAAYRPRAHPYDNFTDPDDISALTLALGGSDDSWTGIFIRLVQKSDPQHKAALRRGCPVLCAAIATWNEHADGKGTGVIQARAVFESLGGDKGFL